MSIMSRVLMIIIKRKAHSRRWREHVRWRVEGLREEKGRSEAQRGCCSSDKIDIHHPFSVRKRSASFLHLTKGKVPYLRIPSGLLCSMTCIMILDTAAGAASRFNPRFRSATQLTCLRNVLIGVGGHSQFCMRLKSRSYSLHCNSNHQTLQLSRVLNPRKSTAQ